MVKEIGWAFDMEDDQEAEEREETLGSLEQFVREFVRDVLGMELNDE